MSSIEKVKSNFFRSIRYKLIVVIAVALSLAMLIASLFFVAYDRKEAKQNLTESISAIAKITAERTVAALAFVDKNTVDQNLDALLSIDKIRLSCLYHGSGLLFSSAVRNNFAGLECQPSAELMQDYLQQRKNAYLTVHRPVAKKSTVYGDLFVIADLSHLYERMINIVGVSILVSLLSGFIAYLLTIKLQYRLVSPIESLSEAADKVTFSQDYSIRAQRESNDEVGDLVDSFNAMLQRIEGAQEKLNEMVDELSDQGQKLKFLVRESETQRDEIQSIMATASHDLKQPLQAMAMFIAALRGDPKNHAILVDKLERSIDNMKQLFADLMDVSSLEKRIQAGSIEEKVSIPALFDQLFLEYQVLAEEKGLTFSIIKMDLTLETYEFTFQRIIRNLLNNALRYTNKGGITLACREKLGHIVIDVWDTGVGMHKDKIKDVFREFVQLKTEKAASTQGVGLGLSIVKRCCELLDYSIEVKSRYGRGSLFRIYIPKTKTSPLLSHTPKLLDASESQSPTTADNSGAFLSPMFLNRLEGKSVLMIDDDELVRDALESLLASWKTDTRCFSSGVKCMEYLANNDEYTPDIIISDYQIGQTELGDQVITDIHEHYNKDIPAVIVTGYKDEVTLKQLKEDDFIVLGKPIKPAKLRSLMESLI